MSDNSNDGRLFTQKATKKQILALPFRGWDAEHEWFDALLIAPTRLKHDSGWAHIAIVGVHYSDAGDWATHILAMPDDIVWPVDNDPIRLSSGWTYSAIRADAYYPSGVLRLWSRRHQFAVDHPGSSVTIEIRERPDRAQPSPAQ